MKVLTDLNASIRIFALDLDILDRVDTSKRITSLLSPDSGARNLLWIGTSV